MKLDAPRTVDALARLVGARVEGDAGRQIDGLARLDEAGPTDLSLCVGGRWMRTLATSRAGAVLLRDGEVPEGCVALRVADPRRAFAIVIGHVAPEPWPAPAVHPTAVVDPTARVGSATVEAYAVISADAVVEDGAWIGAHAYVGRAAHVGEHARLGPHAVVLEKSLIGRHAWVHPGAVIGAEGFGHVRTEHGPLRVPHRGRAVIEAEAEVGANACVDRAVLGQTRIGRGTRLDNLVQVAHGVEIGEDGLLAAFSGIAGGARLGDRVVMGGRSAVVDGVELGDDVTLAALASASSDAPSGARLGGSPATRYERWLREVAALRELPAALRTLHRLERRLAALEATLDPEEP